MAQNYSTTEKSGIAYQILAYLHRNPDAQDTLEGIIEWWLLEQDIRRSVAKVEKGLAELMAGGFIVERKGRDSRVYYRINRRKAKAISALLRAHFQQLESVSDAE